MDLMQNMNISAGGMFAQSQRMKVVAENIANADSVQAEGTTGPGSPYRAKQIYFQSVLNRHTGATEVQISAVKPDMQTPLRPVYKPGHDLADARGFVMYPNVDSTLESINMREAQRSYEANLAAIETSRDMMTRTLDLMR